MNKYIIITLLFVLGGLFTLLFSYGMEKNDKATCIKLQAQSEQYDGFYLTEYQDAMCTSLGININAPVLTKN
jgi:hypothetical protein